MARNLALLALAALMCVTLSGQRRAPDAPNQPVSVDLEHSGVGYPVFRIPALATSMAGTLIAAYDGRPSGTDLPGNIALLIRRSTDGGDSWSDRQVVRAGLSPRGFGDPSLLVDRTTGRIFLFHAASVNKGFFDSGSGNAEDDPNILHADYSYSDDDGLTWRHRRITPAIKDASWGGLFAASGEGIQLRRGPHAGRLIQQYVVRHNGGHYAASAYSDDHGATWHMGRLLGPGLDENKTVELSDGTLMLNSRSRPLRRVAFSRDGGVTYEAHRDEPQLIDPANNGSIIRIHPHAPASSDTSRWLLFSNTESSTSRERLTVKLSCDDGTNWPIRKTVEPGAAGYSTLTMLSDSTVGLLFERGRYEHITFTRFPVGWLDGGCARSAK